MRILIVEDEPPIAEFIRRGLVRLHYSVDVVDDGEKGYELAVVNEYDLILLDIMLPGMNGREICRALRADGIGTPVLLLTALGANEEVIGGLDDGADDYLVKPFDFDILLARIRSLIRRTVQSRQAAVAAGGIVLDTAARTVTRDGTPIELTSKEFALLEFLILHKGEALSRRSICEHVWDITFDARSNVVDSLIRILRQKLDRPGAESCIRTVRGFGYLFDEPVDA